MPMPTRDLMAAFDLATRTYERRAQLAMTTIMAALEGWAKSEHSYTDRTGNLTNSIAGFVAEANARGATGVLTARMDYAIFVELAREGKWAFLWPVLQRHEADIKKLLEQEFGGGASVSLSRGVEGSNLRVESLGELTS